MGYVNTGRVAATVERFGQSRRVRFIGVAASADGSAVLLLNHSPAQDALTGELYRIAATVCGDYSSATAYTLQLLDDIGVDWLLPTLSSLDPTATVNRQMFAEIVSGQFARPLILGKVDTFRLDFNANVAGSFCIDFWLR